MRYDDINLHFELSTSVTMIETKKSQYLKLVVKELDNFIDNLTKEKYDPAYSFESLMLFKYESPGLILLSTYKNDLNNKKKLRLGACEARELLKTQINNEERTIII